MVRAVTHFDNFIKWTFLVVNPILSIVSCAPVDSGCYNNFVDLMIWLLYLDKCSCKIGSHLYSRFMTTFFFIILSLFLAL
jgi:hypothetical protein